MTQNSRLFIQLQDFHDSFKGFRHRTPNSRLGFNHRIRLCKYIYKRIQDFFHYYALILKFHIVKVGLSNFLDLFLVV